mgnify:CR=1 FL=1|jgi:hypothetical protein
MKRIESYPRQGGYLTKLNLLKKERKGGSYDTDKGRDFFGIHWEIQHKSPNKVRLHIESPIFEKDPILNDIKKQIIKRILDSEIGTYSKSKQLEFKWGERVSEKHIKNNKSTEAFKILLSKDRLNCSNEENIHFIDNIMGLMIQGFYFHHLGEIIEKF